MPRHFLGAQAHIHLDSRHTPFVGQWGPTNPKPRTFHGNLKLNLRTNMRRGWITRRLSDRDFYSARLEIWMIKLIVNKISKMN